MQISDEVRRLVHALASRTLGRARLIRAGQGPLVDALAEMVLRAFGPVQIVDVRSSPWRGHSWAA